MAYGPNLLSLIQVVYDGIGDVNSHTNEYFKDRIILPTQNDIVDNINNEIIDIFHGVIQTFLNANVTLSEVGVDNKNLYSNEYLNSLDLLGLPPSKLHFKIGCPIMLLCNIAPEHGLCNGSQLIVTK
jgi:ATP-dependent DNA helicase PIF1